MTKRPGNRFFKTNEQLYEAQNVQNWMQKLATIRKGGFFPLNVWFLHQFLPVPLFTDDQGCQYQITICGHNLPLIPHITCPLAMPSETVSPCEFFELRYRAPIVLNEGTTLPPRNAFQLGVLHVKHPDGPREILEQTDYSVIVDADSLDMPFWIVASRQQLQSRPQARACFPIFDSLMDEPEKQSDRYYDIACILDSVCRMGIRPSEEGAPNFQESCELVRQSRARIDPAAVLQPRSRLSEYVGQD